MKQKILIFAIAFAGALAGANVTPLLSGAGKLIFPENSTPATISASSGALTAAAGGTNQNVVLAPSGTGFVTSPGSFIATDMSTGFPAAGFMRMGYNTTQGELLAFDGGTSAVKPLNLRGNPVFVGSGNFGPGNNISAGYPLDTTGDTNTSGVYRVGGTAGQSITVTIVKTATGQTTCTLIFTGGVKTGGTC